jgi:hypothetical protein
MQQGLPDNLTFLSPLQTVKKFSAFHKTLKFLAMFTATCH